MHLTSRNCVPRPMQFADLEWIEQLEARDTATAPSEEQWVKTRLQELLEKMEHNVSLCRVAERGPRLIGYQACSLQHRSGLIVLERVFVGLPWRRQGIGKCLLEEPCGLVGKYFAQMIHYVRESNKFGQLFLRDCGFQAVKSDDGHFTIPDHFEDPREDGYRMAYPPIEDIPWFQQLPPAIRKRMYGVHEY